jgi:hypothetical protein
MNVAGELTYAQGCPMLLKVEPVTGADGIQCRDYIKIIIKYIEDHPEFSTIIMSARWTMWVENAYYKQEIQGDSRDLQLEDVLRKKDKSGNEALFTTGLIRMIEHLSALNRSVVIVAPIPEVGYTVPSASFIASRTGRDINKIIAPTLDEYLSRNQRTLDILQSLQEKYGFQIIEPWKTLCKEGVCRVVTPNGLLLYTDDDHLSAAGADLISPDFDSLFESLSK